MRLPASLERRARHRGLHGHAHIDRERRIALVMVGTGLGRVAIWTLLLILYLCGVAFARELFASVAFVAVLSVLALMLTDWGQVAASLAQLAAAHSHHDAEATRRDLAVDYAAVERDVHRLARLTDAEADELADAICQRLRS